jgi:putative oxidoreductase
MTGLSNLALLAARILLAAIFIKAGYGKLMAYEGTMGYMTKSGVPGGLLPVVILVELVGGILILVGWQTRLAAIALAGFTVIAGLLFHYNFGDMNQTNHFMKNVAIAGGFLALFASGPGAYSVEGRSSA